MSKHRGHRPQSTLLFMASALVILCIVEFGVFKGDRPYYPSEEGAGKFDITNSSLHAAGAIGKSGEKIESVLKDENGHDEGQTNVLNHSDQQNALHSDVAQADPSLSVAKDELIIATDENQPQWMKYAVVPPVVPEGYNKVIIIIDDLGVDRKRSLEILDLPAPITAAFLPYAKGVKSMADNASIRGHEILIHMPMEAETSKIDLGSIHLKSDMDPKEILENLDKAFHSINGFIGINNHMGSKLTQDQRAMEVVMSELYKRGLAFVDSKTISTSIAEKMAADHNVPHAGRDVFLDHDPSYEGVIASLQRVEEVAKRQGYAVAIGHPKENTIRALREWLPTLDKKKLILVPVSSVIQN
jgi:polysaccharide deacetylase 2 family uncharacterized protein YibQ